MGTRGIYGFHKDGDKLTYNHYDSYPDGLGLEIMHFIQDTPLTEMMSIYDRIELVKEDSPTPEQAEECAKYANDQVSTGSDWYATLRESQGNLSVYKEGLRYMIDSHNFIFDSLFCEWGYVINLDDQTLEVYKGFQKELQYNRYLPESGEIRDYIDGNEYKNCRLIQTFSLYHIQTGYLTDEMFLNILNEYDKEDEQSDV